MKIILFLALLSTNTFATNAEQVAAALEERLRDALSFDLDEPNNVHNDTKLRRFEDGNPMWLQLYVRPSQNKLFYHYYGKGFKTGRTHSLYTNIANISDKETFEMRHESPWSYKFSGIGKFYFYRKPNFKERFYSRVSSNDRPKKHTFGTNNNGYNCRCSHANPNCNRNTCGHRERIGSVKFCPGISVYARRNYVGTPFTYYKCDAKPGVAPCFKVGNAQKTLQSFHFDALIKTVIFYKSNNCSGANSWYSYKKQNGTVPQISDYVKNRVGSLKIVFKKARYH